MALDFIRVNRPKRPTITQIADKFLDLYTVIRNTFMDTDQLEDYLKLLKKLLRTSVSATLKGFAKQVRRLTKDELTGEALLADLLFLTEALSPQRCPSANLLVLHAMEASSLPEEIGRKLQVHLQECTTCQRFLGSLESPLKHEGTQKLLASLRDDSNESLIDVVEEHFTNKLSDQ